jgi:hypothetical protein
VLLCRVGEGREHRASAAKHLRVVKLSAAAATKREKGGGTTLKNVCIVALTPTANPYAVAAQLIASGSSAAVCSEDAGTNNNPISVNFSTFKARAILSLPPRPGQVTTVPGPEGALVPFTFDVTHTLAAVRVCDVLILVVDLAMFDGSEGVLDAEAELFLRCLKATGVPSILAVLQGIDTLPHAKQSDARKYANRLFSTEFGEDQFKIVEVGWQTDPLFEAIKGGALETYSGARTGGVMQLTRTLCSMATRNITWRSNRSYMLGSACTFEESSESPDVGTLKVYGHLRGRPLNVHQLVCLPSGGVYQLHKIEQLRDPTKEPAGLGLSTTTDSDCLAAFAPCAPGSSFCFLQNGLGAVLRKVVLAANTTAADEASIAVPDPEYQETLECVASGDPLSGEQTWPVGEEGISEGEEEEHMEGTRVQQPMDILPCHHIYHVMIVLCVHVCVCDKFRVLQADREGQA